VLAIQTTGPSIMPNPIGAATTSENTDTNVTFAVSSPTTASSNLIVTASNSGDSPPGLVGKLTLSSVGSVRTLTISPAANLPSTVTNVNGSSLITITVTDGTLTNSTSFPLTVLYVNQPPTIAGLTDQTTAANVPFTVNFTINDVDDPVPALFATASASTPSLGSAVVGGSGAARTLTYTPAGLAGTNHVTVTVSDTVNTVTETFTVVVTNGLPPVVAAIPSQTIAKVLTNTVLNSAFAVYTGPLGATNLQVLANADNTNLVPLVVVSGSGSNYTATTTVAALQTGVAYITVFAGDEYGIGTNGFTVTVTATNYPPTLGPIADQTTGANTNVTISLVVSDPDDAITNLTFTGSSTNAALVNGVTFAYNGTAETAMVHLVANASGHDRVTISVADGVATVSQSFNLTVTPGAVPPELGIKVVAGLLQITITGAPNASYGLLTSTDLRTWTDSGLTITAGPTGIVTQTIPFPANEFLRAYVK
jgi:hypothetical protein